MRTMPPAVPPGNVSSKLPLVGLSLTISRPTRSSSATRNVSLIYAATRSIEVQVWIGTTAANSNPVNATCTDFPASATSIVVQTGVPIGQATVKIAAFDGPCTSGVASGNVLSAFAASGNVLTTSTTFAAVFNAGRPVTLSRILPAVPDIAPPINTWQSLGPRNFGGTLSGKLNSVVALSSGRLLAAGGFGQSFEVGTEAGIFSAAYAGGPWTASNHGLADTTVNALISVDNAGSAILAATQFGGIYRSTDGGVSWSNVYGSTGAFCFAINGNRIYAGVTGGIVESVDNGGTWTKTLTYANYDTFAIAVSGSTVIAGSSDNSIYANTAGNWSKVASIGFSVYPGGIHALAIDPASPTTVLATVNGSMLDSVTQLSFATQLLYRSADAGLTWTQTAFPSSARGAQAIAASPTIPHRFYIAGTILETTNDAGLTFLPAGGAGDSRGLLVQASPAGDIVYLATDQGLARSIDGGQTFTGLSGGIANSVVFDLAASGSTVLTAVQDYSPITTADNGATWKIQGGSGLSYLEDGVPYIHPASAQNCYLWDEGGFHVSSDGCQTFVTGAAITLPFGAFGQGDFLAGDPTSPNVLYAITNTGIVKSTDAGRSFTPTGWTVPSPNSIHVGADGKTIQVLSRTTSGSTLYASTDGGTTFAIANITAPYAIAISSSPKDPTIVVAVATDYAQNMTTYVSSDSGLTFQVTSNIGLAALSRSRSTQSHPFAQMRGLPWTNAFSASALGRSTVSRLRFSNATSNGTPWLAVTLRNMVYVSSDYGTHWHDISGDSISHAYYGCAWVGNQVIVSTAGQGALKSIALF